MFKKFDTRTYEKFRGQYNIFVLVGNGFDISVLKRFKSGKLSGKTTSYVDFYDYISTSRLCEDDDILYQKVKEDKSLDKENWSDFENTIKELLDSSGHKIVDVLEESVDKFQGFFTKFLNELVDAETLLNLDKEVSENKLSIQSLARFLKDLEDLEELKRLKFVEDLDHFHLFNFVFANFNYTSLLDNYLFLDKVQFNPRAFNRGDRSFYFRFTLPEQNKRFYSSYLLSEVIHPHGIQDIPRSILFGIDLEEYDKASDVRKRLVKGYWSQYEVKYKSYLEEADLFIIYGMSLGATDAWWMDTIFDQILNRQAELILYWYGKDDKEAVVEKFINCCARHKSSSDDDKREVRKRIHVVSHTKNDTYFLGFEKKCSDL